MRVMRSTKTGSTCADCGAEIKIGDPIAYFGPKNVYGLTCHTNAKTVKHLQTLQEMEAQGSIVGEEGKEGKPFPRSANPVSQHIEPSNQQEWVCRVYIPRGEENLNWGGEFVFLTVMGYANHVSNFLEVRAPRNVAQGMTKFWAERVSRELNKGLEEGRAPVAEAAPLWV